MYKYTCEPYTQVLNTFVSNKNNSFDVLLISYPSVLPNNVLSI